MLLKRKLDNMPASYKIETTIGEYTICTNNLGDIDTLHILGTIDNCISEIPRCWLGLLTITGAHILNDEPFNKVREYWNVEEDKVYSIVKFDKYAFIFEHNYEALQLIEFLDWFYTQCLPINFKERDCD